MVTKLTWTSVFPPSNNAMAKLTLSSSIFIGDSLINNSTTRSLAPCAFNSFCVILNLSRASSFGYRWLKFSRTSTELSKPLSLAAQLVALLMISSLPAENFSGMKSISGALPSVLLLFPAYPISSWFLADIFVKFADYLEEDYLFFLEK